MPKSDENSSVKTNKRIISDSLYKAISFCIIGCIIVALPVPIGYILAGVLGAIFFIHERNSELKNRKYLEHLINLSADLEERRIALVEFNSQLKDQNKLLNEKFQW